MHYCNSCKKKTPSTDVKTEKGKNSWFIKSVCVVCSAKKSQRTRNPTASNHEDPTLAAAVKFVETAFGEGVSALIDPNHPNYVEKETKEYHWKITPVEEAGTSETESGRQEE